MAIINVPKTDTFDAWRIKTNTIGEQIGDNALLVDNTTLTSDNLVDAVLETLIKVETEVGIIGALTTTAPTLVGALNEHDAEIGVVSTLTTTATTLVGALNEHDVDIGVPASLTTTAKNSLVSAVNELDGEIGVLSTLTTSETGTIVGSINATVALESSRYENTIKSDLTHVTVGGNNTSTQSILSNLSMPAGATLTVGGTLDISGGTLVVGGTGGNLNIQTTFLTLGDTEATTASSGGLIVSRGKASGIARPDVRLYWDESTKKWIAKKLDDAGTASITPFLVDSYNIKDFVVSNTENGIAVTYDELTNKLNFDVNDFTVQLSGDVVGTATVTNLASINIATTVQPNSVALGTDTTGAYVSSIALSGTTPGLTVTQSAAGAESNVLTNLTVDSTVIRNFGAQAIAGVKTFSERPIFSTGITTSAESTLFSATVTNDLNVQGNLTVSGTLTTVNTETVTISDNIILLNSNAAATPTEDSGFEVERGNSTNVSVLWDETNDDWTFYNGSNTYYMAGQLLAGGAITVSQDATEKARWTVNHADTSSVANLTSDNSGLTVLQDIAFTFDTYGHVTAASVNTTNIGDATLTITAGAGMSGGGAFTANQATSSSVTLSHADTSSQASVNNSAVTVIQDITLDTYGHITAIGSTDLTEDIQDIVGNMFAPTNIENGINVYYDDASGKIQSDVNDFTITLTGAATGSGTVNNLGNVSIDTSINTGSASFINAVKALMPRIYNVNGTQVFPV